VVKACAGLLRAEPDLNVSFAGDRLLRHRGCRWGSPCRPRAGRSCRSSATPTAGPSARWRGRPGS
jgi:hypothetical protein